MRTAKRFLEEYVPINGIRQYLLHYPVDYGDVMLNIHGGPGLSEAYLAYYATPNPSTYSSVYYDQRGAGKTLCKNRKDMDEVTFPVLFEDLKQTVDYLKEKYQKNKIIIQGHSWGSVLGLLYAHKYPEDVQYYIGSSQVVDFMQGASIIFGMLKSLSTENRKDREALNKFGDYPHNVSDEKEFFIKEQKLRKIKSKYSLGLNLGKIVRTVIKSPVFGIADILPLINAPKVNHRLYSYLNSFSATEISDFKTPMYFLHGENDGQIPISQAKEYCNIITAPDKGFYSIAGAGHTAALDNLSGVLVAIDEIKSRFANAKL